MVVLNKKYRLGCAVGVLALLVGISPPVRAELALQMQTDLMDLILEELMDIKVTAVARKPERLAAVPVAVHVVTREDIRRSGATSLPAALRTYHVLFVGKIAEEQVKEVMEKLGGAPVLTVGKGDGFIAAGGMVNFVLVDGKVRFVIDGEKAKKAGGKVSSKLLKLSL